MAFETEYAKWIEKIALYLRRKYNRDYRTVAYAYELRFFSGYSPKDVMLELENLFPYELGVKKSVVRLIE